MHTRRSASDESKKLSPGQIQQVFDLVDFSEPYKLPGLPGALVTGIIIITFQKDEPAEEYHVLNNRMVVAKDDPLTAYHCKSEIRSLFEPCKSKTPEKSNAPGTGKNHKPDR